MAVACAALLVLSATPMLEIRTVSAAELRSGQNLVVRASETIQDDLYAAGQSVQILGTIEGDLVVAANQVSVTGSVNGDLIVLGGTVAISGPVYGVVRALGGRVSLDSAVEFDAILAGGEVIVGPSAHVGRDVLLGFGDAEIAGRVDRHVRAWTETLSLAGTAIVGGDVIYSGGKRLEKALMATVQGRATQSVGHEATQPTAAERLLERIASWMKMFVALAAFGLLLAAFFPNSATEVTRTIADSPWASLGLGVALLILVPIVTTPLTILGVAVGGWWIGLVVFALWLIALPVGYVAASLRLGLWITGRLDPRWSGAGWSLLAGMVALEMLGCTPYAGWWIRVVALLFGLGALCLAGARGIQRNRASAGVVPRAASAPARAARVTAPRAVPPLPERQAS